MELFLAVLLRSAANISFFLSFVLLLVVVCEDASAFLFQEKGIHQCVLSRKQSQLLYRASCYNLAVLLHAKKKRNRKSKNKSKVAREPLFSPDVASQLIKPKLLVFDLDNTLWTPELYQIRKAGIPKAGKEIRLFDGAQSILFDLATNPDVWEGTQCAIASRTHKGDVAEALLRKFKAAPDVTLEKLFVHRQIMTGSKRKHFQNLREDTGVHLADMVFFDDDARLNLVEIEQMGVLCCHCPRGVTVDLFRGTLKKYDEMKKQSHASWMGVTVSSGTLN